MSDGFRKYDRQSHIAKSFEKLVKHDSAAFQNIIEMSQYTVIFIIIVMIIGRLIFKIFPQDNEEEIKNRTTLELLVSVCSQTCICVIAFYYIDKIAKVIPPIVNLSPSKYEGPNMNGAGEAVIAIYFMRFVPSFGLAINELIRRYYNYLDGLNIGFI